MPHAVISDTANGGQVLVDEDTFGCIKEQLQRLGAVTADGLDYQLLHASQPQHLLCGSFSRFFPARNIANMNGAVVLDMGLYSIPARISNAGFAAPGMPFTLSYRD
eukprot:gene8034-8230_t